MLLDSYWAHGDSFSAASASVLTSRLSFVLRTEVLLKDYLHDVAI